MEKSFSLELSSFATGGAIESGGVPPWAANILAKFRKIQNDANGIITGPAEDDAFKKKTI
jgi:hypothetical protein